MYSQIEYSTMEFSESALSLIVGMLAQDAIPVG